MATLARSHTLFNLRTDIRKLAPIISRSVFFSKKKGQKEAEEDAEKLMTEKRRAVVGQDLSLKENLNLLATKTKLTTKRGYKPPSNVEEIVEKVTRNSTKVDSDWREVSLENSRLKFKILSQLIKEFAHDVPNTNLHSMKTVSDAVEFFNTEIRDTTTYEDFSKQNLPKNLHIQMEYLRFDPENDKMFGGRTAFPGQDTIVSSIKYKRKYKSIRTKTEKPGYADHYYGY